MKDREAQDLYGREARKCGVFARATPLLLGTGVDLEVRQRIVREGDERLPSAVGSVCAGRHGVEGEPAFQLRVSFLVRPWPAMKCQRFASMYSRLLVTAEHS